MALWTFQSHSKRLHKGKCPVCPSSDAYEVYEDGHAHCYSCGEHWHPARSITSLQESLSQGKKHNTSWLALPEDFEYNIPSFGMEWLNKYGLTEKEKRKHRIGWSDSKESMIFPVFGADVTDLLMFQERYFGNEDKPKWLTRGYKNDVLFIPDPWYSSNLLVLVEDIISAIKVCRVTNSMPIFGSSLSEALASKIIKEYKHCKVWLDPDANKKAIKAALLLSEMGLPTTVIMSKKDPKEYGTAEIRELTHPLGKD